MYVLSMDNLLQNSLDLVSKWLKDWRIKANETKSIQVSFTNIKETCPPVNLNGMYQPQEDHAMEWTYTQS